MDLNRNIKQSPIIGVSGIGGGTASYILYGTKASGDGYQISRSVRLNSGDSAYFNKTFGSGNQTKWTFSFWIKRSLLGRKNIMMAYGGDITEPNYANLEFNSDNTMTFGYASAAYIKTTRVFRDTNAWYHIVLSLDTNDSTPADRVKLYVNGVRETDFSTTHDPDSGQSLAWNGAMDHRFGSELNQFYNDCYFAEVNFIDGQALTPTDFGEFDEYNVWNPKSFTGSYGSGTYWSSFIQGTVDSTYPLSNLFGGTIGSGYTNGTRSTNPGTLTLDLSSKNLTVTNVRLSTYIYGTPSNLSVNGTPVTGYTNGDNTSVIAVNGQLNTIAWSYDSGSGPYCYMRGIEVDYGGGAGYELLTDNGTTGRNSFRLNFSDNSSASALGKDSSGHSGGLTPHGFSVAAGSGNDSLTDTPTNYGTDTGAGGEVLYFESTRQRVFS